jgi:hypothetical protein
MKNGPIKIKIHGGDGKSIYRRYTGADICTRKENWHEREQY